MLTTILGVITSTLHATVEELRNWQTAFGAMLGFIGVIVASRVNAGHARKKAAEDRETEAKAIATALYAEMFHLRRRAIAVANEIGRRVMIGSPLMVQQTLHNYRPIEFAIPEGIVFKGLVDEIGMLNSRMIFSLVHFHSALDDARAGLKRLEEKPHYDGPDAVHAILRPIADAAAASADGMQSIGKFTSLPQKVDVLEALDNGLKALRIQEVLLPIPENRRFVSRHYPEPKPKKEAPPTP